MRVLVPVADGSEEIETITIVDVLRRAGAEVSLASVMDGRRLEITASRQVKLLADCHIDDVSDVDFDLIALPGGLPGAEYLRDSQALIAVLRRHIEAGRRYAAICAAPALVLAHHGLLDGAATAHPGFVDQLPHPRPQQTVVIDGHCITSQAPGTAIDFALTLVEQLYGRAKRDQLAAQMVAD